MTDSAWLWSLGVTIAILFVALCVVTSRTIRLVSELEDTKRRLKTSQLAHALDVQSLTTKLSAARSESLP